MRKTCHGVLRRMLCGLLLPVAACWLLAGCAASSTAQGKNLSSATASAATDGAQPNALPADSGSDGDGNSIGDGARNSDGATDSGCKDNSVSDGAAVTEPVDANGVPLAAAPVGSLALPRYRMAGATSPRFLPPTGLYDAPDQDAERIDTLYHPNMSPGCLYFYLVRQQGDWCYGAYLGQLVWCLLSDLRLDEHPFYAPDFLPETLLEKYVQAYSLYARDDWDYLAPCDAKDTLEEDRVTWAVALAYGGEYAPFQAVFDDVFTGVAALQYGAYYKEVEGRLYLRQLGVFPCGVGEVFLGFYPVEQTADRLTFTEMWSSWVCTPPPYPEEHTYFERTRHFELGEDGVWRLG